MLEIRLYVAALFSKWAKISCMYCNFSRVCPQPTWRHKPSKRLLPCERSENAYVVYLGLIMISLMIIRLRHSCTSSLEILCSCQIFEFILRWLDWIFGGGYLPSLSINYVAMNKGREKKVTTTVLYKDENFL